MKQKFLHLNNPPITEALVEVRFQQNMDMETIKLISEKLKDQFPIQANRYQHDILVKMKEEHANMESSPQLMGVFCKSKNEEEAILLGINRFSYHRMPTYPGWETFLKRFNHLYNNFVNECDTGNVSRIGLRCINSIELPQVDGVNFENFLKAVPRLPEGITNLDFFDEKVLIPKKAESINALYKQSVYPVNKDNSDKVIYKLDIDAFATREFSAKSKQLDEELEKLRCFKNDLFFGSVTEMTLEPYK